MTYELLDYYYSHLDLEPSAYLVTGTIMGFSVLLGDSNQSIKLLFEKIEENIVFSGWKIAHIKVPKLNVANLAALSPTSFCTIRTFVEIRRNSSSK